MYLYAYPLLQKKWKDVLQRMWCCKFSCCNFCSKPLGAAKNVPWNSTTLPTEFLNGVMISRWKSRCGVVWCSVLQCVVVCCSLWQSVAVWCSELRCVAVCMVMLRWNSRLLQSVAKCCSVSQCVAVCCSVMISRCEPRASGRYSLLRCVAARCCELQCLNLKMWT